MTEKRLHQAFDYQRFAGNERLQAVIDASHARSAAQLSDDDLEQVAAGVQEQLYKPEGPIQ